MKLTIRTIGIFIILFCIAMSIAIAVYTTKIDALIDMHMNETDTCFIDGKCIHEEYRATEVTYGTIALITLMFCFGFFLVFRKDGQQQVLSEKTVQDYEVVKKVLSDDEKKILAEVEKEKEITQDSLRFRLDWSKAKISTILTNLDKQGIIQRRREGKTYVVFFPKEQKRF